MNESTTPPAWQPGDLVAAELDGAWAPMRGMVLRSDESGVDVAWDDGRVTRVAVGDADRLRRAYPADAVAPQWVTLAHTQTPAGWRDATDVEALRAAKALGWSLKFVAPGEWLAEVPESTARFVSEKRSGEFHATVGDVHVRFTVRDR